MGKGYVHVYTGNGKGKTTAAIGLAIRAIGAGKKVYMGQFVKSMEYNELKALKAYRESMDIESFGNGCFITNVPEEKDINAAKKGIERIRYILQSGQYDVVILDEMNIAVLYHLINLEDLEEIIDQKPDEVELIITGRYASKRIIEKADLVTEMKEIKHYYNKGVLSRDGIDR